MIESGAIVKAGKQRKKGLTTLDIVLIAILAIANGVLSAYLSFLNQVLTAVGGPILTSIILGLYSICGILAAYIIRKPGVCFLTLALAGIIQVLSGSTNGLISFIAGASEGIGGEMVLALFLYKRYNWLSIALAGMMTVPIFFVVAAFWFGYIKWGLSVVLIALLVRALSGLIIAGLGSKIIGDLLAKTGILKGYAISKQKSNLKGAYTNDPKSVSH
ncbi:ECF transporter S component [Terrilactibacillus laevilacticus]|uniref:ECF transporter S component n=1 Tax=Terrilactibacillus laevilacticus TaxID=1380157 RepID=A0ABW5PMH0_9BACI|nr:ECF transporter S component [Terrilactibacillus laevilacticus]